MMHSSESLLSTRRIKSMFYCKQLEPQV